MCNTPLFPSLSGRLWFAVVEPDRVLPMGQIELNRVLMLKEFVRNRTVFGIEIAN